MANLDDIREVKKVGEQFHCDVKQEPGVFFLKGSANHNWGIKNGCLISLILRPAISVYHYYQDLNNGQA